MRSSSRAGAKRSRVSIAAAAPSRSRCRRVGAQLRERGGQRGRVAGRHEPPGDAVRRASRAARRGSPRRRSSRRRRPPARRWGTGRAASRARRRHRRRRRRSRRRSESRRSGRARSRRAARRARAGRAAAPPRPATDRRRRARSPRRRRRRRRVVVAARSPSASARISTSCPFHDEMRPRIATTNASGGRPSAARAAARSARAGTSGRPSCRTLAFGRGAELVARRLRHAGQRVGAQQQPPVGRPVALEARVDLAQMPDVGDPRDARRRAAAQRDRRVRVHERRAACPGQPRRARPRRARALRRCARAPPATSTRVA